MPLTFAITARPSTLSAALQTKIDQKTKPLGALGQLEALALQIGLCQNSLTPSINKPCIIIFAGDHGIVEAGVSAYPQTVTAQMVNNFLAGGAAISVFARQHGIELLIADAGVNADLAHHPKLINAKIGKSSRNFLNEAAMTVEERDLAMQAGADLVAHKHQSGCNCIGFGEMGIANTASASLLMHSLTGLPLTECVGRGTGLDNPGLVHKIAILQQAAQYHQADRLLPLQALACFGGFEIAMMVGAYLQAAELRMVVMVDGFIASAALLVASQCYPAIVDYCVFSHASNELGHQALLSYFNAKPLLNLDMRLGEGSGVAVAFPVLQSAVVFLNEMATFAEAGVDQ